MVLSLHSGRRVWLTAWVQITCQNPSFLLKSLHLVFFCRSNTLRPLLPAELSHDSPQLSIVPWDGCASWLWFKWGWFAPWEATPVCVEGGEGGKCSHQRKRTLIPKSQALQWETQAWLAVQFFLLCHLGDAVGWLLSDCELAGGDKGCAAKSIMCDRERQHLVKCV